MQEAIDARWEKDQGQTWRGGDWRNYFAPKRRKGADVEMLDQEPEELDANYDGEDKARTDMPRQLFDTKD